MNPMLLLQGAAAVSGLIGGFIPDKKKEVEHQFQTEGSDLAGRVPGAIGAQTNKEFTTEEYQSPLKKTLLNTSKVLGTVGSIGGALMPNLKMPKFGVPGSELSTSFSNMSESLLQANLKFKPFEAGSNPWDPSQGLPTDGVVMPPLGKMKGI